MGFKAVLILGGVISLVGVWGLLMRKSLIVMLMSLELVLLGALTAFVGAARYHSAAGALPEGVLIVPFVLAIAAAEVCVGLSLILKIHRAQNSTWVDDLDRNS